MRERGPRHPRPARALVDAVADGASSRYVRAPAAVPVIDAHNHLGRWLARTGSWMAADVGELLAGMDAAGVEHVVILDGR